VIVKSIYKKERKRAYSGAACPLLKGAEQQKTEIARAE
jgi:hypothetical protein